MEGYITKTITRYQEGASIEDMENGEAYETAYLVYNEDGELIWDTTNYDNVKRYFEESDEEEWRKYRVYGESIYGKSYTLGYYNNNEYDKAVNHYVLVVGENIYDAVRLQLLNKEWGWVDKDIKSYLAPDYEEKKERYWEAQEKADASSAWRPGDARWDAPGMSIHDFI